jgi:peptidyl-prolyl cis-trans isomerase SurA
MTKRLTVTVFLVLLFCAAHLRAGQIIDRIVATVNGHIILQSDWDDAVRCEALMNGHGLPTVTSKDRKDVLDRLIDQELLREQIPPQETPTVSDNDVSRRLAEIRKFYDKTGDSHAWAETLAQYQVTIPQIKDRIVLQMQLMWLVNSHLRGEVQIDQKSIESYYNLDLVPQLDQSGGKQIPLAKATPQIKEILTQRKMNELLIAWLQNLHAGSKIVTNTSGAGDQAQ